MWPLCVCLNESHSDTQSLCLMPTSKNSKSENALSGFTLPSGKGVSNHWNGFRLVHVLTLKPTVTID